MEWLLWIIGLIAVLAVAVSIASSFDQESSPHDQADRAGKRRISPSRWIL